MLFLKKDLQEALGDIKAHEVIHTFFEEIAWLRYKFKEQFDTEKKIEAHFGKVLSEDGTKVKKLLLRLFNNRVLLEDHEDPKHKFHFRFDMHKTSSYHDLPDNYKQVLYDLYIDYFYKRQDSMWRELAMQKV